MKIGFYVSGSARRCVRFLESYGGSAVGFVLTDEVGNDALAAACRGAGVPLVVSPGGRERVSDTYLRLMRGATHGFVLGKTILVGEILAACRDRLVNFHPSVLPSYRGLVAYDRAREGKSFLLGNTAHFVVREVDAGPVVMQQVVHQSRVSRCEELLDRQVPMMEQVRLWLAQDRVRIEDGYVVVLGADYSGGEFIPALEFTPL